MMSEPVVETKFQLIGIGYFRTTIADVDMV